MLILPPVFFAAALLLNVESQKTSVCESSMHCFYEGGSMKDASMQGFYVSRRQADAIADIKPTRNRRDPT